MMTNSEPALSVELTEEGVSIEFPAGLIGLTEWKRFVLMKHPDGGPLCLLQSLEDTRLSFILADPRQIILDYQISLTQADLQALQLLFNNNRKDWLQESVLSLYCILSVQEEPFFVTVNLLGPLVINWNAGIGRQIILSNSGYETRYTLYSAEDLPVKSLLSQEGKEQN
ncbi:MAG: flagellar assembly protein FliW [Anaerolineales bacterium]|nr:flagellar assembly protein FliW [Anaerolineales bacterium]